MTTENGNIKDESLNLIEGVTEAILDSFFKEGIFKDVPILGSIISINNLRENISDKLFLEKLKLFFLELEFKDVDELNKFKKKCLEDTNQKELAKKIIHVLDKFDEEIKAKWLANLFRAYIQKEISLDEFKKCSSIINLAYPNDLYELLRFRNEKNLTSNNKYKNRTSLEHLYSIGVLSSEGFDGGDAQGNNSGTIYILNKYGKLFLNHILSPPLENPIQNP